jgi:glycosyltransferase involved in cell wall biosynthesis
LRIAQVSPLYESVPPLSYGGTERVAHFLTEELVAMGHDVTLFASGDSITRARLIAPVPRALRLAGCKDFVSPNVLLLEAVLTKAREFDLIHFHTDNWHFPFARRLPVPCLTTAHGRLDLPELVPLFREFKELPMISISDAQREPLPSVNWAATVYHGLPPHLLPLVPFNPGPGQYLAFTGRISPEKRPDLAIEIARRAGLELRIAAKVDAADREYFEKVIRPLLGQPGITWVGEIGDREKRAFLGNALALLFPIDWPEPFGLVMIEAMSCGTPVIAFCRGSVPEVIDHGLSGLIVHHVDQAVEAVVEAARMSREIVRETFEARFTSSRMAEDYVRVYRRLCGVEAGGRVLGNGPALRPVGAEHGRNR